jgi:parvulin-like peptidyl-prolyl isomerase
MIRPSFAAFSAIFVLLLSPLAQGALAADQQIIDGIAAIVNGEVITFSQVRLLIGPRERILRQQYTGAEYQQKLKEAEGEALQDLIDRELIVQSFKKEKFTLPEYFVEQRINDIIRENFNGDRNTFMKMLQAQNFSLTEFKKNEYEKIIVSAMRGKNVSPNIVSSPTKIADYYHKHPDEFTSKEQVKLRMIMIPSRAAEGNSASQKAMAEEILGKLAGGADFAKMAQIYSEDSTRDLGGDWGWIDRKTLAGPLENIAFGLPVGKISNIVEVGGNYYILKVDEKRGGVTKSLAEVRDDIDKKLKQEEAQRLQENWLAGLRQKATIRTF